MADTTPSSTCLFESDAASLALNFVTIDFLNVPGKLNLYRKRRAAALKMLIEIYYHETSKPALLCNKIHGVFIAYGYTHVVRRQDQSNKPATATVLGSHRYDGRIRRAATLTAHNFATLSPEEQAQAIQSASNEYARTMNLGFRNRRIADGLLEAQPGETQQ